MMVEISKRGVAVKRRATWDPLLHVVEGLVCDACERPGYTLFLCEKGHLVHEECLAPQCVECKRTKPWGWSGFRRLWNKGWIRKNRVQSCTDKKYTTMANIEEEYLDVLQNIEFAIISVYRSEHALSDYDASKILNILVSGYQAELSKRNFCKPNLSHLQEQLYKSVKYMREWQLGREAIDKKARHIQTKKIESIPVEEIIACLKRIRKSVKMWNKQGGRKGYLEDIDQFLV